MKTHKQQSIACNVIALSATMLSCCLAGAADTRQEFAEPPLKYATRPLWFWNNTTVTEEGIVKQMQDVHVHYRPRSGIENEIGHTPAMKR
jgi:hypothetical protein